MSTCQLRTLAQSIQECTTLLSQSWHDNEDHGVSSCATQGVTIPPMDKVGETSRNQLISSLRKLERLILGPKDTLQSMYFRSAETGVVHALCNLKVPHNVPKGDSISYVELATKLNVNQDRLTHLVRNAIVCSGFLDETTDGRVKHSPLSSIWYENPIMAAGNEVMLDNLPLSAFNIAANFKRDPMDTDDTICPFSVYRGDTALFQWFEQNPEQGRKFAAHMRAQSSKNGDEAIRDGYDWTQLAGKTLVDCGGSFGSVGAAILSKEPNIDITVQDLPKVIESAKAAMSAPNSTIPSSLKFAAHSFLEPQPTVADIYLYRMVFHNWSDAGARRILNALKPALRHGTKVILIEYVMPKMGTAPDYAELQTRRLDNTMYALMNGKVRELDEFKALFSEVEPKLKFESYKAGEARATHDPRSHSVMAWVFEDDERTVPATEVPEMTMAPMDIEQVADNPKQPEEPVEIVDELAVNVTEPTIVDELAVNVTEPMVVEDGPEDGPIEIPSPMSSQSSTEPEVETPVTTAVEKQQVYVLPADEPPQKTASVAEVEVPQHEL